MFILEKNSKPAFVGILHLPVPTWGKFDFSFTINSYKELIFGHTEDILGCVPLPSASSKLLPVREKSNSPKTNMTLCKQPYSMLGSGGVQANRDLSAGTKRYAIFVAIPRHL